MALYLVEVKIKGGNPAFVIVDAESVKGAQDTVEEMINVNPEGNPFSNLKKDYDLKAISSPTIMRLSSLEEGDSVFPNHLI